MLQFNATKTNCFNVYLHRNPQMVQNPDTIQNLIHDFKLFWILPKSLSKYICFNQLAENKLFDSLGNNVMVSGKFKGNI